MKQMTWILLFVILCLNAFAEEPAKPCSSPQHRQFDFWVGEWSVTAGGKPAGDSSVQLILDDCVVFENWTGVKGYTGKSFNLFNATLGKWQQYWVDNQGGVLVFTGDYKEDTLRFEGTTPQKDGAVLQEKLTFFKLSPDRVRQLWEQSKDGGKTWTVAFDGDYRRKK